jgi:hypothetical protein
MDIGFFPQCDENISFKAFKQAQQWRLGTGD